MESAKNTYETLIGKLLAHSERLHVTIDDLEKKAEKEKENEKERERERENEMKEKNKIKTVKANHDSLNEENHKRRGDDPVEEKEEEEEENEDDQGAIVKEKDKKKQDAFEHEFLYTLQDYKAEASMLNDHLSLVYIQYMHFCRRTEGLTAARTIFSRARKLAGLSWAAFVTAARMEYFATGSPSITSSNAAHPAFKIFELGYKRFSREPPFLVEYMKLLLMTGDASNARSLLERSISMSPPIPPSDLNELWILLMDYEKENGSLSSLLSLSDRKEKYLNETHLESVALVERTKYLTLSVASGSFLELAKTESHVSEKAYKKPGLVAAKKKKSALVDGGKGKRSQEAAKRSESLQHA